MPRRPSILISDIKPGAYAAGYCHACANCGALFLASADAIYCSNACRVAYGRKHP